ncbi:alpha/beta fold hydrolase [Rodentibacter myodis]|uniref:Alpha/beta hydrolase n=1 Tax=Rodentibacter myodis TaxID=1907939 RepID=A0A1V3JI85_9PAST|nr:alpha/beta hydrolase [Rodentibacter myodis]OOF56343.1 alpha/beta hydrolase [Rodentibacter myodis]
MKKITALLFLTTLYSTFGYATPLRYFGQTAENYQSQTPYGNNEQVGHYATADDGAKIYYEIYGKGSPFVVLHGGLVGSPAEMGEFMDKLRADYQVISISTRGHGKSQVGQAVPTYAQKAADLQAVLKAAQITQKVGLLGFSDGGYTALTFAAQYPNQTAMVIAIGAGEWKKGFIQGGMKKRAKFAQVEAMDSAYWQAQQKLRPEPQKTAQWFTQANQNYDNTVVSQETFGKIQAPVLLVVGEDDTNAPLDSVLAAYKMLPQGDLAVIPNTPHATFIANFPAVWAVVKPYLTRLDKQ